MIIIPARRMLVSTLLVFLPYGNVVAGDNAGDRLTTESIASREAYIVGKPPRIEPLAANEFTEESLNAVKAVWKALGVPPQDTVPEFFGTMLHHPSLMKAYLELSAQLFQGTLSVRDRELIILRIGWLCQAPYEWGQHVAVGKKFAGFNAEEIQRVKVGSSAAGWSQRERYLLRAVEELFADAMITDETWAVLAGEMDKQQLLELPVLIGFYQGVAYLQNSLRMRLTTGVDGLKAK